MNDEQKLKMPGRFRNWLSLSGMVLGVSAMFAFILLFFIEIFASHGNPYMGILTYVVAPMFFFTGLGMVIWGGWIQRRRSPEKAQALTIDLSRTRDKRILAVFIFCSVGFLLLTAMGSYQTYHITESNQFCGQTCHVPMKPEHTAYMNSPHARVGCVECHVGPGATWYLKAKLNGVHQLVATIGDSYNRPIKTPIKNLRPAQDTCEQCHWPEKFTGNLDRTYTHFLSDETNTPFSVRLLLKVGGGGSPRGPSGGIHWHMNPSNKVEYMAADEQRQIIPWVRVTSSDGTVTEYRSSKYTNDISRLETRVMDCIDCHNRPAHDYQSPNDAVDIAMAIGKIDQNIPWVKSNSVHVLTQTYATEAEALKSIDASLRRSYPNLNAVGSLVAEVQQIFRNNIFPEMKADWRAYPDNISHKNSAGCFRCHDGSHKSTDGKKKIAASDCTSCHIILAQGSGEELEKLNPRGHEFFHIDGVYTEFSCAECHTGAFPK
jgi:nitrate/TMAO reductase-like tetraheme cytochrome c subunit